MGLPGQLCVGLQIGIGSTPHFSHFPWTRRCPGQFSSWWRARQGAKPNYRSMFKVSAQLMSTHVSHWPKQVICQVRHWWMGDIYFDPSSGGHCRATWQRLDAFQGRGENWTNPVLSPTPSLLIEKSTLKRLFPGFLQKFSESFFQKLPGLVRFLSKFMVPESKD